MTDDTIRKDFEEAYRAEYNIKPDDVDTFQRDNAHPDYYWKSPVQRRWEGYQLARSTPSTSAEPAVAQREPTPDGFCDKCESFDCVCDPQPAKDEAREVVGTEKHGVIAVLQSLAELDYDETFDHCLHLPGEAWCAECKPQIERRAALLEAVRHLQATDDDRFRPVRAQPTGAAEAKSQDEQLARHFAKRDRAVLLAKLATVRERNSGIKFPHRVAIGTSEQTTWLSYDEVLDDAIAALSIPADQSGSAQAVASLRGKYDDVLGPFLVLMEKELHANSGKGDRPGWLRMSRATAMLEIYYHVSKLQKAVKDNNVDGIREYAADVANMAMMAVDVCGALIAGDQPEAP